MTDSVYKKDILTDYERKKKARLRKIYDCWTVMVASDPSHAFVLPS